MYLEQIPTAADMPDICRKIIAMDSAVHRLFHFLVLGQIATKLWRPIWKRSARGERVIKTHLIKKHGKEYYGSIEGALAIVKGLLFVCGKLGDGCIFWLLDDLTDNL